MGMNLLNNILTYLTVQQVDLNSI